MAEEEGGVVEQSLGRPEVTQKLEEGRNPSDVAATLTEGKSSDVELPFDVSGVGARGKG